MTTKTAEAMTDRDLPWSVEIIVRHRSHEMITRDLLERTRDLLTERYILAQDDADGATTDGYWVDDAPELPTAFVQSIAELGDDAPVSRSTILTLTEIAHADRFEWQKQVWKASQGLGAMPTELCPEPDPELIAVMQAWTPKQLADGREMDDLHAGDYQTFMAAQHQPSRLDEDYVAEAQMVQIDPEEDEVASQRCTNLRRQIELVHEELARREAKELGYLNEAEYAASDCADPSHLISTYGEASTYVVPSHHRRRRVHQPKSVRKPVEQARAERKAALATIRRIEAATIEDELGYVALHTPIVRPVRQSLEVRLERYRRWYAELSDAMEVIVELSRVLPDTDGLRAEWRSANQARDELVEWAASIKRIGDDPKIPRSLLWLVAVA